LGISALPLGAHVIAQDLNVPLIVQPQLFGLFSLLSRGQFMYYGAARSRVWCILVLGGTLVTWGGLEAALVFALRVRVLFFFFFPHVLNRLCVLAFIWA